MKSRRLAIKEVKRAHPIHNVKPEDFETTPGDFIDPVEIGKDPKFTLYCFDWEKRSALFVESDDPAAVDQAPFYYQGQVEHAVGLVEMPLEEFHQVAAEIAVPRKGLIFIHSVGRCGSTLLSKVLAGIPSIHSLSEPDDLTQMVTFRSANPGEDDFLRTLIESSTKWRCKPRIGTPADYVGLKTRSEVAVLADLIGPSFPRAKHFFLYRQGLSWMRTLFRGFPADRDVYDEVKNREVEVSWSRTLPLVKAKISPDAAMNPIQVRILAWITCMEAYLSLAEMDLPICAARFEDLTAHPKEILSQFFKFCDIDGVDWDVIDDVLSRDSQAGTIYDREERKKYTRELTPELVRDAEEMIASRPLLKTPDIILPRTLSPTGN